MQENLLTVKGLSKYFSLRTDLVSRVLRKEVLLKAVDHIDFNIRPGETLGLVGESGCGKSTTARLITRLIETTSGEIWLGDSDILQLQKGALKQLRKEVQIVFQDPYSSLNPRKTVYQIIGRPLEVHGLTKSRREKRARVVQLLNMVGLGHEHVDRYPHEFSGGQRQRIAIARALALEPRLIIADEPVSALDVSVQAQILNLLLELQNEFKLAYLFIAHDLSVIEHISDRVAVMYMGKIVETGDTDAIFNSPLHPYTRALNQALPVPDPRARRPRLTLKGEVTSPLDLPPGCRLQARCPQREKRCMEEEPKLTHRGDGHYVACFNA